jgi:hypothetical protein
LVFVAYLHARLEASDRSGRWLATAVVVGGTAAAATYLVFLAVNIAASGGASLEADPAVAKTLFVVRWEYAGASVPAWSVFVGATSAGALRLQLLPRWLCWAGLAFAAILFLSGFFGGFGILAARVWIVASCVALLLQERRPKATMV